MAPPNLSDKSTTENPPKLPDKLCVKHYSIRTEHAYLHWIKRYIFFHDKQHPKNLGAVHIEDFPTHLAVTGKVAASTQNHAKRVERWLNVNRRGSFEWIRRAGVFKRRVFI